jgi:rhodanese-related sulfurtransferase
MMFRQATRESMFIICAAVVLGFSYTFLTGKGFFAAARGVDIERRADAGSPPSTINLEEARTLYETKGAIFIDARHEFDFRRGHIKSALSIPLSEFDSRLQSVKVLPKDKVIIVYCDGSECNSSIELAAKLYENGFGGVRFFLGGWQEWSNSKLPTESGQ